MCCLDTLTIASLSSLLPAQVADVDATGAGATTAGTGLDLFAAVVALLLVLTVKTFVVLAGSALRLEIKIYPPTNTRATANILINLLRDLADLAEPFLGGLTESLDL